MKNDIQDSPEKIQKCASTLKIAFGHHNTDPRLEFKDLTFKAFAKILSKPEQGTKHENYFIRGGGIEHTESYETGKGKELGPGYYRNNRFLKKADFLIIDGDQSIDNEHSAPPPELVHQALESLEINHIIYTSHSHNPPDVNKFRVVIPCEMNKAEVKPTGLKIIAELNNLSVPVKYVSEMGTMVQRWYMPTRDDIDDKAFEFYQYHEGKAYGKAIVEAVATPGAPEAGESKGKTYGDYKRELFKTGAGHVNYAAMCLSLANRGLSVKAMMEIIEPDCELAFSIHEREWSEGRHQNLYECAKSAFEKVQGEADGDDKSCGYSDEILSPSRAKPLEWLWRNRICKKSLTTIVGPPGVSKSTLMCDIVARITTGNDWPDGCPVSEIGNVLWLNGEDPVDEVLIPRLQVAGADVEKVQVMPNKVRDGLGHRMITFKSDVGEIRRRLDANPNIKLLIVDPISAFLEGADTHKMSEVRNILSTLQGITEEYGISVIVVTHPVKNFKGLLVDAVNGSAAFQAAARMIAGVLRNPTLEGEILFGNIKSNHTKSNMPTLRYVVEEIKRPDLGPDASYGKVDWQPGESDVHIEKIVGEKFKADTKASKDLIYRITMMKYLNDGPMPKTSWEKVVKSGLTKSGNTIGDTAFNKIVKDMVDEGAIDRKKLGGRKGKTYVKKADQEWPEFDGIED